MTHSNAEGTTEKSNTTASSEEEKATASSEEGKATASSRGCRILFDCSHTVHSPNIHGIERVVRCLARELPSLAAERNCRFETVRVEGRVFVPCESPRAIEVQREPAGGPSLVSRVYDKLRLSPWLRERMFFRFLRRVKNDGLSLLRRLKGRLRLGREASVPPVAIDAGSVLVLPDAYWGVPEVWPAVERARQEGAFVIIVIHDIIPLTHPQFVPPDFIPLFQHYLDKAHATATLFVCISCSVAKTVAARLPEIFPEKKVRPSIDSFRIGADFDARAGAVRPVVEQLFQIGQPAQYITVSTFNPRKRQDFTLAAFEQLWERNLAVGLVYIGGRGWMSEELLSRIEGHCELGHRLFVFHDLSDAELQYCYRHAAGTISASVVEGFDLPVVESLWYGCKTFASDIAVHREIAGDEAEYFSLAEPQCLADAVEEWERNKASSHANEQSSVKPMSWQESADLLLDVCLAHFERSRS